MEVKSDNNDELNNFSLSNFIENEGIGSDKVLKV